MEDRRRFIQQLFTRIAPRYDWFNRLSSCGLDQRWRRQALARGRVEPGMRLLDVCTGTGDLALLAARRQQGRGEVVGMDLNEPMLHRAVRKQSRSNFGGLQWLKGDALALPFSDGSFDRVAIGFSTRNLGDLSQGLREMVRVLKPGGQLIVLETGRPSNPILRAGYHLFLLTVVRLVGLMLTGRVWPFTYLARSVRAFLTPQQFVERLEACQTRASYTPLAGGLASLYLATKGHGSDHPSNTSA